MEQDNKTPNPYYDGLNTTPDNNGSFYVRPGQSANNNNHSNTARSTIDPPNTFAKAAMILGGIALVSVFTFTIFPAVILGALALILALLSRGSSLKMHPTAKSATILATIALCTNIALVGGTFYMIFGDNSFHEELNTTYEEMFGMSYDEILEGIMDGTLDYDDLYEQMYENMY